MKIGVCAVSQTSDELRSGKVEERGCVTSKVQPQLPKSTLEKFDSAFDMFFLRIVVVRAERIKSGICLVRKVGLSLQ